MGNITAVSYSSSLSSPNISNIFGGIEETEKLDFLEGIIRFEADWEDVCVQMITDKNNAITIKTIPIITKKIALAAVANDINGKFGAKKFLMQKWKKECEFMDEKHNQYECDIVECTECDIDWFMDQSHIE